MRFQYVVDLPAQVSEALRRFGDASEALARGEPCWVPTMVWQAVEQTIIYLLDTDSELGPASMEGVRQAWCQAIQRMPKHRRHAGRIKAARELLGVPRNQLEELRKLAETSTYPTPEPVNQLAAARKAMALATKFFARFGERQCSQEQRTSLHILLSLNDIPLPGTEGLEALRQIIVHGRLTTQLAAWLDRIYRRLAMPRTDAEAALHADLSMLLWQRASQQGDYSGPNGSASWMARSRIFLEDSQDWPNVIRFLSMRSILLRQFDDYDGSWDALQTGYGIAGDNPTLQQRIRCEHSKLLIKLGRGDEAVPIARMGLMVAKDRGAADDIVWMEQTVGLALAASGSTQAKDAAEEHLRRGIESENEGYVMLRCVGLHVLSEFYEKAGRIAEARAHAMLLKELAEADALWSQARLAEAILERLTRTN